MKIQYTNTPNGYNEIRNFIKPLQGKVIFLRKQDLFQILLNLRFLLTKKGYHPLFKGLFFNPFLNPEKRFWFFNTILIGRNPWQVTFETTIPRLGKAPKWLYKLAVKQLKKPNCQKIYALSQCAYYLQKKYLEKHWPKHAQTIISKMCVKYPYQEPLIDKYEDKPLHSSKIVFTLTGADFFRKGGMEVLNAFDQLIPKYPQLHLNIISSLNYGDYATHTTIDDQKAAKRIIAKFPGNITHYPSLPNEKVLEIYKASHIGLLPTWADSFGYSVLEAQAAGCPCITTNIRALPEINDNETGWVIELNEKGYIPENRDNLSHQITELIKKIITEDTSQIKSKGISALNKIKKKFNTQYN
ncbi:glycosyltransferase family 4 protein [Thermophagus sp. OGC60D27]|uniref:glycosyltransferase family 4 protein n=1 Tax=Thermophagus sp. OGC60D27 TaxID=3458415 RepID=UPI004037AFB0